MRRQNHAARRAAIAANSASGSSAKLVSASASSTTAASLASAAGDLLPHRSPDPAARPQHHGVAPLVGEEFSQLGRAIHRPHHHRQARRRIDGQRLARARDRHQPGPGPQCAARCQPRRAGASTTRPTPPRRGRGHICGRRPSARGNRAPHSAGSLAKVLRLDGRPARLPECRYRPPSTGPQCSRPGSSRWPGLRRKKVTVCAGLDRHAHHRAGGAVDPARQIDRDHRQRRRRLSPRSWRAAGPRPRGRARRRTVHRR